MATKSANFVSASSQSLSASDSASLQVASTSFTIEFWIKSPFSALGVAMGKDQASGREYAIFFDTAGKVGVQFAGNAESYASSGISANTWAHVAIVRNGTSTTYYLNGSSNGGGGTSAFSDTTTPVWLGGRSYSGAENYLDCKLSNVRVWNTVRSGTEINDNKSVVIDSASGLVASWVLNNSLSDGSGNSNTLTNNNSVTFVEDAPFETSTDITVDSSVLSATFSLPASTVTAIENVTVSPSVLSATFSVPTHAVTISVSIAPSALSATFTLPAYDVMLPDVTVAPSVLSATFTIPSYTITAERHVTVSPSLLTLTASIPTYSIALVSNITISPSPLLLALIIPTWVVTGDFWQEKYSTPVTSWGDKY